MLPIYLILVSFHMCLCLLRGDFILISYQSLAIACNLISSRVLQGNVEQLKKMHDPYIS